LAYLCEDSIEKDILDFCRFPVPRTPSGIILFLKSKRDDVYKNTPPSRAAALLRDRILDPLVTKNILVCYTPDSTQWPEARELLRQYCKSQGISPPRKLNELYQANFFYLSGDVTVLLPPFPDINLDLTAMFSRFTSGNNMPDFTWQLLNLFQSYAQNRDQIKMAMHRIEFDERELDVLERALNHHTALQPFFDSFPFRPDAEKAAAFLRRI